MELTTEFKKFLRKVILSQSAKSIEGVAINNTNRYLSSDRIPKLTIFYKILRNSGSDITINGQSFLKTYELDDGTGEMALLLTQMAQNLGDSFNKQTIALGWGSGRMSDFCTGRRKVTIESLLSVAEKANVPVEFNLSKNAPKGKRKQITREKIRLQGIEGAIKYRKPLMASKVNVNGKLQTFGDLFEKAKKNNLMLTFPTFVRTINPYSTANWVWIG